MTNVNNRGPLLPMEINGRPGCAQIIIGAADGPRAAFPLIYRLLRVWHGVRRVARRIKLWWLERRRAWGWATAAGLYELQKEGGGGVRGC